MPNANDGWVGGCLLFFFVVVVVLEKRGLRFGMKRRARTCCDPFSRGAVDHDTRANEGRIVPARAIVGGYWGQGGFFRLLQSSCVFSQV